MHLTFFPLTDIGKFIQLFKLLSVILNSVVGPQVERSLIQVHEYNGASFLVRARITGTDNLISIIFSFSAKADTA